MGKSVFCVLLIVLASNSWAAWTGKKKISYLKAQKSGIYVKLEGFVNNDPDIKCNSNGFFMKPDPENNYDARVSFLLAAQMTGQLVNFSYYSCASSASHIELGSVAL